MAHTPIIERFRKNKPILSAEFFPPKNSEAAQQMLKAAESLQRADLDFVSITYGAGGSTREKTLEYGETLNDQFDFNVMPHLTCVGHSQEELRTILSHFNNSGFRNIMALRGDPPKGETNFKPHPNGFHYASELVAFIKTTYPNFCVGVAGYPEKHPEAPSLAVDLRNLKNKVDQGAQFITTQLFFDNQHFFKFEKDCRSLGITVPIIPGLLIPHSLELITRFCGFCKSSIPNALKEALAQAGDDKTKANQVGIEWTAKQVIELIEHGVPGVHFYILNRADLLLGVIERVR